MKKLEAYVVPWVREAKSYSVKHVDFAWKHPDVRRMMSNENPLPPSEKVVEAITQAARQGNLYPHSAYELRQKLAQPYGLGAENVILGGGSNEIIDIVIRTFVAPDDEVIIPVPTYSPYEVRTRINGGKPVLIPLRENYDLDVDGIIKAISGATKLIFLCNPNNPTGNRIAEAALHEILAQGIPTVIDEAYYECELNGQTMAYYVKDYTNAIVMRTFSKAYGLAGLRIGYAFADAHVIEYLSRVKMPWNVSLTSLAGALAAIEDREGLAQRRALITAGRDHLQTELSKIEGLRVLPSEGNFVLVDATECGCTSKEIVEGLLEEGFQIRSMSSHHMGEGFVRITVGTPAQNECCVAAFRRFFQKHKAKVSHER